MITREQIEEIQAESREKGISIKRVLQEKGIPEHQYFWWKKKYACGRRHATGSNGGHNVSGLTREVQSRSCGRELDEYRTPHGCRYGHAHPGRSDSCDGIHNPEKPVVMFSLGDGTKFWLYSKPTDMRKNFNMLSGIVNNCMQQNLYSGDVFVFVNASNNMLKLLRYEPGGLVIYNKRLDHGRMHLVERVQEGDPTITPFEWHRLIDTIQGIIDDPRRRLRRLKALRDIRMEESLKEMKTF